MKRARVMRPSPAAALAVAPSPVDVAANAVATALDDCFPDKHIDWSLRFF